MSILDRWAAKSHLLARSKSVLRQIEAIESADRLSKIARKVHAAESLDELKLK